MRRKVSTEFLLLQTQILTIQCALKEYDAKWLDGDKKVTRDASGRFATKSSSDTPKAQPQGVTQNSSVPAPADSFNEFLGRALRAAVQDFINNILDKIPKLRNRLEFKPPDQKQISQLLENPTIQASLESLGLPPEEVLASLQRLNSEYSYDVDKELEKAKTDQKEAYTNYLRHDSQENYKTLAEAESRLDKLEKMQHFYKVDNPAKRMMRRVEEISKLYQTLQPEEGEVDRIQDKLTNGSDISDAERQQLIDRKSELLKIEWRKDVINAELKYGKQISDIAINSNSQEESEKAYQEFIGSLKNNRRASVNNASYHRIDVKPDDIIGQLKALGVPTSPPVVAFAEQVAKNALLIRDSQESKYKNRAISQIGELNDILPTPAKIDLEFNLRDYASFQEVGGEAMAVPAGPNAKTGDANQMGQIMRQSTELGKYKFALTETKGTDGSVDLNNYYPEMISRFNGMTEDENLRAAVWHETGHIVEFRNGAVEKSSIFREERHQQSATKAGSSNMLHSARIKIPNVAPALSNVLAYSGSMELDETYDDYQAVVRDARVYAQKNAKQAPLLNSTRNGDTSTEIVSIGAESLSNPRLMTKHANVDRESFLYALSVLESK